MALVCLAGLLAYVFRSSFDPALLLFANDAPFGVISAQADIAWTNFLGYWQDLNWLGSAPSAACAPRVSEPTR